MSELDVVRTWAQAPHEPGWVADAMRPGPNGKRFDTAAHLDSAAITPGGTVSMYDSVNSWALPSGAPAYAGYYNGTYANIPAILAAFPGAMVISVTPDGAQGANYIDVEPGCSNSSQVAAFIKAGGLGFYASPGAASGYSVGDCINACAAAGVARSDYRIWSAHWIGRHICGPNVCGYPAADGTQYVSTAGWDESVVNRPGFFAFSAPSAGQPTWQEWVTDGTLSLAQVLEAAGSNQSPVGSVLSTLDHYGNALDPILVGWLNAVLTGVASPASPISPGAKLWILDSYVAPFPAWQTALYDKLPAVRYGQVDAAGSVPWVRQVQLLCQAAGSQVGADGDFGSKTQTAVTTIQNTAGVLATGWVDPVTWEILLSGGVNVLLPTVTPGETGAPVKVVQALCGASDLNLVLDGVFGAATEAAVKTVQKFYSEPETGQVDAVTWSLLAAHAKP